MKDNKLIAEFMGVPSCEGRSYQEVPSLSDAYYEHPITREPTHYSNLYKVWNDLMPVVREVNHTIELSAGHSKWKRLNGRLIAVDFEGVFESCVNMIHEHNMQRDVFPFEEGDTYYTIENSVLIRSCWDDESKRMYSPERWYLRPDELEEFIADKTIEVKIKL